MRCYYNGSGFTVSFNEDDAADFSGNWPASSVDGRGSFSFDSGGDLISTSGAAEANDGADWAVFAERCREYGMPRYEKRRLAELRRAQRVSGAVKVILGETDGKVC